MQAIQTKTTKPTGTHGARIRAKCAAGSILAANDPESAAHAAAVEFLELSASEDDAAGIDSEGGE